MTRSKPSPMIDEQGEVRELSDRDLKKFRPAHKALPASLKAKLGVRGPQRLPVKERVTIRMNPETVGFFRETGKGWQSRLDEVVTMVVGLSSPEKPRSASMFNAYFSLMAEVVVAKHALEDSRASSEALSMILNQELSSRAIVERYTGLVEVLTKHDMTNLLVAQGEMLHTCKSLLEADPYIDKALLSAASGIPDPEMPFSVDNEPRNLAKMLRGMAKMLDQVALDKRTA